MPNATRLSLIPTDLTLQNFAVAIDRDVLLYLMNSFIVVGIGLLLQIAVSVSAACALARQQFPGLRLVFPLILSTMMLPEEILAIPLSLVLSDVPVVHVNLIGSLAGMIIPVGAWAVLHPGDGRVHEGDPGRAGGVRTPGRGGRSADLLVGWCCHCAGRRSA